ncbi:Alpha-L-AF-C domain-containing protein [Sulfidibacter corallicola]|uniref:non-reducing end alpha-L-arabinofuranosidase n=1 Tax=Sulfidibacter corallicola TaxID=2818388 RepID=A0A8A4TMJ3_SULCO|nr:hypothetical protein [Sulfidibacter corallicola]QTD50118.1 hypothetical protein J3U87_31425 [Sulfidibacter corallicola]
MRYQPRSNFWISGALLFWVVFPVLGRETETATVEIDARRIVREIPKELFGVNTPWRWNGTLLWIPATLEYNADVLRHTKALAPSLVRFPGGTLADYYDWRKGIGPQKRRPPTSIVPGTGKPEIPTYGTDEALEFARRIGARLLIVVNCGTGTPEMAAEWVRYINVLKAAEHPEYRVTYWEIGNELYHKPGPGQDRVHLTPEAYARRWLRFEKAMRAVDPDIRIGAIGLHNLGAGRFNSFPRWNETILRSIGDRIDFFSQHNGYAPVAVADHVPFERGYRTLLASTKLIEENLATVTAQIERWAPKRADRIPIAVTEWAPLFHAFPRFKWTDHSKTLGSALFTASMLRTFVESPQVGLAMHFKLTDPDFLYLLGIPEGTRVDKTARYRFQPAPSYFAFQFFTRHFGERLVASRTEVATFSAGGAGWITPVEGAPLLEVTASLSGDGKRLYLIAINKSFSAAIQTSVRLRGFEPKGEAVTRTLTGSGLAAYTGTGRVIVPGITYEDPIRDPKGSHRDRNVRVRLGKVEAGKVFEYRFPKHSVTSFVFSR